MAPWFPPPRGSIPALDGNVTRMGLQDKITGRAKQAAGDLLGNEGVRRQGLEEERKGEEKEALERQKQRVEGELEALDQRQQRVENLEKSTDATALERDHTRAELENEARDLGVNPTGKDKGELAEEIKNRR
jgi:uncharacterized protein YjbJ (UPF0337 family)